MIWLAWRQQRFPFTAAAILTCLYCALAVAAHVDAEFVTITQLFAGYLTIGVCMFWGVPLVARDLEQGTHQLAWTQSRPRTRWLAARFAVAAAGALTAAAAVTAVVTWALPSTGGEPMRWFVYESHDLVPLARVLFALTLGAALGAVTRNTHLAMALSVPVLGVVQLGGARAVREASSWTYWQLQAAESGLYLGTALALAAVTFLAVRRRP